MAVLAAALVIGGCAARPAGNRFIVKRDSGPVEILESPLPAAAMPSEQALRRAEAAARAARTPPPAPRTVESVDPELRTALAALGADGTPAAHVRAALAYRRAGVLDRALDLFDQALQRDSRLAAAYDGRARIWRDWHLASVGMADAVRAVYFAPSSAAARNTLGTLLVAVGDCEGARRAFEHVLTLSPDAVYAKANLRTVEHDLSHKAPACGRESTLPLQQ